MMTGLEKIKKAKRLCTPRPNQEFDNPRVFRFWILSLAIQISELCESDHSQNSHSMQWEPSLRPFRSSNVGKSRVCEDLRRILNTPLNLSERQEHGMGYVYVLRSQIGASTLGELKIGFSKYHPEHRAHELARCLARPEIVSHTPFLPHAKRLESIIHTELQACRKVQSCPRCCKDHREWFTVSHADSREAVTRWSTWILQRPYLDGKLTDEWKDYLTKKDFGSIDDSMSLAEFWKTVIDEFRRDESQDTESQRIGKYLNECYWDVTCDQFGLTQLGKEFCDTLREDVSLESNGKGISMHELSDKIDAAAEKLRDLQEKDRGGEGEDWMYDHSSRADIPIEGVLRSGTSLKDPIHPDSPISTLFGTDTPLSRMFHPETKVHHVLNQPLLRSIQRQEMDSKTVTEDLLKLFDSFKTLKTGAISVSDPILGVTESPLGDATMLPVLALKDLKYLNVPVANWLGMSPTNAGFQYVQEAYESGKWFGRTPRFQLPKVYRKAGYKSLSAKDVGNGPCPRRAKEKAKDGNITSEPLENDSDPDRKHNTPSFQLTRGPDFEEFKWTAPMNDELIKRVDHTVEEIRNDGRANVENRLGKALRYFGVDAFRDVPIDEDTTDSDSSVSSGSSLSKEEERDLCSASSSASPSMVPVKRKEASSSTIDLINAKKAKLWLESL